MYRLAVRPSSVPRSALERRMSPVAMWTPPNRSTIRSAWVPLPAPGGPTRTMRIP